MGAMFNAFFGFLTKLFTAAEKLASAGDHLATWADESAGQFEDEARLNRQIKLKELQDAHGVSSLPGRVKAATAKP